MELQQIRYFISLSQEKHFNRAAKRMHVTQPTLSQQIKKMEEEIGSPLFERSSQGVNLTPAGEQLLPHAIAMIDELERGITKIQEESGEITGTIRLAAIPTMAPYIFPPLIREIKHKAPDLKLQIFEETTSVSLDFMQQGKIDLGILSPPINEAGIVARTLGEEVFYVACAKSHPFAKKKHIKMSELKKEQMLILQEGHCFSDQALDYCKRSRHDDQVIFQGSSLTSVLNLAESGEGITLVPKMAIQPKMYPNLKFIPFANPAPKREIGVIWRVSAPLRPAHRLILETVSALVQKLAR